MFDRNRFISFWTNPRLWQGCFVIVLANGLIVAWSLDLRVAVALSIAPICWVVGKKQTDAETRRRAAVAQAGRPVAEVSAESDSESLAEDGLMGEASLPETMLSQHRYALLVRARVSETLDHTIRDRANRLLWDRMGLLPEGNVNLTTMFSGQEQASNVWVDPVLLDRHCVSNQEFFEFVAAGGYQQPAFWDEEVVSGLLDFVDTTGLPGPRFWTEGAYPPELANHPVVGVSWYEAAAYARWIGKRLPSDAEWIKAGSWPVATGNGSLAQRKYPWGNTMDRSRTNLWGSGPQTTVPVGDYTSGVSVGGIYQLTGNVWEWTSSPFIAHPEEPPVAAWTKLIRSEQSLKSIRGGAFDTYFDSQATCQFQSGEHVLGRKHNVGFRCALSACDVANLFGAEPSEIPKEEVPTAVPSEDVELEEAMA